MTPEEKKKHTRRTILLAGISFAIGAVVNHKIRDETLKEGYLIFDNITAIEIALESLVQKYKVERMAIADLPCGEITYERINRISENKASIIAKFNSACNEYEELLENSISDRTTLQPQSTWPHYLKEVHRTQQQLSESLERYANGDFTFKPLGAARRALALGLEVYGIDAPNWQPFFMDRAAFAQNFQRAKERAESIDLASSDEYMHLKETLELRIRTLTSAVERNGLLDIPELPSMEERIPTWIDSTKDKTPLLLCTYGGATNALVEYLNEQSIPARHECCETIARKV